MKKIFTFAVALVCALAVNAETTVSLSGSETSKTDVVLTAGQATVTYLYFTGASTYTGFQALLHLPEGVTITKKGNSTLTKNDDDGNHTCSYSDKGAEGWQLLIYHGDLIKFNGDEGAAMKLTLTADANFKGGSAQFTKIKFTDPGTWLADGAEFTIAEATGIEEVNADNSNAPIYNLQGVRVNKAENGVFIQNGKKFVVK